MRQCRNNRVQGSMMIPGLSFNPFDVLSLSPLLDGCYMEISIPITVFVTQIEDDETGWRRGTSKNSCGKPLAAANILELVRGYCACTPVSRISEVIDNHICGKEQR